MGGEEVRFGVEVATVAGLPPRGRGRALMRASRVRMHRITPAWAGKSDGNHDFVLSSWDYPRVGGEESASPWASSTIIGLPPRGRGRV